MGEEKDTPLVDAAFEENLAAVQALLHGGADVNERDGFNSTALHYAVIFNQLAMVKLLLGHGADVDIKDESGEDALFMARDDGRLDIITLLLEAKSSASAA